MPAKYPFGPKYPFSPDSPAADLHWFQGWGERLQSLIDDPTYFPHDMDWAIFRPDALARKAMMRFGATYPMVIKSVSDALDIAESCFRDFCDDGCAAYTEAAISFAEAERILLERIQTAVEIISRPEPAPAQPEDIGPLSEPDTPTRWAKRFGVSVDTIKRRFKDGTIRNKKLSDRSYQVDLRDIPRDAQ